MRRLLGVKHSSPASSERVTLASLAVASLAAIVRRLQADRGTTALTAAIENVRKQLHMTHEHLLATHEEVTATDNDLRTTVGMYV